MIKSKKRPSEDTSTSEKKKLKTHHSTGKQKANNIVARTKRTNNFQNKTKFNKKTHIGKGREKIFHSKGKLENDKIEDWSKFKKEKKELRLVRKKKKNEDLFEICVQVKKLGEKLRIKTCGMDERNKLCEEIHGLLKGPSGEKSRYSKLVLAHDMTRVIQVMLKYSNSTIKNEILQDLLMSIIPILESNYGHFCVRKMFKYGSGEIRRAIIDKFFGSVVKLTSHNFSNSIIDIAYVTWATNLQKNKLKQEFYGDIYRKNKDESVLTLEDTYKNSEHMKKAMLCATKANLLKIINKMLLDNALFHAVLYEFLSVCSDEDRAEFISLLCPNISTICSTKEGAKCALICLWHATNKEKKIILKNVKEHILKLAKHEHGHMLLLAILCGVDDTVLLNKILVNELVFQAVNIVQNEWGRKILLWLVAPLDTTYFHPAVIANLKDGMKSSNCKKSSEIRTQEILDNCKDALCNNISQNCSKWLTCGPIAIVTKAILKAGSGESLRAALNSIASVISSPEWKVNNETDETISGIEHAGLHMVLKKMAQYDKTQIEKNNPTFGEAVLNYLNKNVIKRWMTCNRACFILLTIIENSTDNTKQTIVELLNKSKDILKIQTHIGAKLLLKHL